MPLRALIIDFNSYFASVEQQDHPELRGQPLVVVPVLSDFTCCIAASLPAKKLGIKTGTKVADAKRICPGLHVLEARPPRYIDYHNRLVKAVDSILPVAEVMSIDEMRCSLTGKYQDRAIAEECAAKIKHAIRHQVGECLTSSIGIAPNGFLAKTASDMMKPDGLVVIEDSDLPYKLLPLELRDFCGVGPRMELRLNRAGIHTVKQLYALPREQLHRVWGSIEGLRLYALLRGEDIERPKTSNKSIGHSHVLSPQHRFMAMAEATMDALLQKATMRLRSRGLLTAGLGLTIEFKDGTVWQDYKRIQETSDTLTLLRLFRDTLEAHEELSGQNPVYVGVTLRPLVDPTNTTPSLFDPRQTNPISELSQAMDTINHHYGKNSLYFAGAIRALDHTPVRIAFTNVPDLEAEGVLP